jgi:hypothetical protein
MDSRGKEVLEYCGVTGFTGSVKQDRDTSSAAKAMTAAAPAIPTEVRIVLLLAFPMRIESVRSDDICHTLAKGPRSWAEVCLGANSWCIPACGKEFW